MKARLCLYSILGTPQNSSDSKGEPALECSQPETLPKDDAGRLSVDDDVAYEEDAAPELFSRLRLAAVEEVAGGAAAADGPNSESGNEHSLFRDHLFFGFVSLRNGGMVMSLAILVISQTRNVVR